MDENTQLPELKVRSLLMERAKRTTQISRRNKKSFFYGAVAGVISMSIALIWLLGWNGVLDAAKVMSGGAVFGGVVAVFFCARYCYVFAEASSPVLAMLSTCAVFSGLGAILGIAASADIFDGVPTVNKILASVGILIAITGGAITGWRRST